MPTTSVMSLKPLKPLMPLMPKCSKFGAIYCTVHSYTVSLPLSLQYPLCLCVQVMDYWLHGAQLFSHIHFAFMPFYAIDCILHSYTAIMHFVPLSLLWHWLHSAQLYSHSHFASLCIFVPSSLDDIDCIVHSYTAIVTLPLCLCAFIPLSLNLWVFCA